MSSEVDSGADVDAEAEAEADPLADDPYPGRTGEVGVPVDAICTGCVRNGVTRVRVKRAPRDELPDDLEEAPGSSFKHVCHGCSVTTYWNVRAVLSGILRSDLEDEEVDA